VYLIQVLQVSALPFFVKILRQRRRKTTNTAPTTLSAIQAASQSPFINEQLYSTCDKQEWQKSS
jgi:hypothetical protein